VGMALFFVQRDLGGLAYSTTPEPRQASSMGSCCVGYAGPCHNHGESELCPDIGARRDRLSSTLGRMDIGLGE
jgi:hypothetical protein